MYAYNEGRGVGLARILGHFQGIYTWQPSNTYIVQKFVSLKSLLTNEAAGYVANVKTEEANNEVAVERLKSRYGKDEVQRKRLVTKLSDMKSLDQSNKAMRDAVDELCSTVRVLEVQGVTTEQ